MLDVFFAQGVCSGNSGANDMSLVHPNTLAASTLSEN